MKNVLILSLLLLLGTAAWGQDRTSNPFHEEQTPSLVISAGYAFKTEALKAGVAYTNIFNRFGAYTGIEAGVGDDGGFSHLLGVTVGITPDFYAWAGMDFFTNRGLFEKGLNNRKEFGLAYSPIPNLTIMPGYSFGVGFTAQVGLRIPLVWMPEN